MGAINILDYDFGVGEIVEISPTNRFSCVEKKEFNNNTITKHIKFVYDGFKLIAEFDVLNSNELIAKYLWAEDNLLTLIKDNESYYYMVDGNKNIVGLVDESATKVNTYEYTPFGALATNVEVIENPFKFSSEYHDTETGLIYYNYRYYNPEHGKWLKRDPIAEQGGFNLYGFINNDPVKYTDYLGLILLAIDGTAARKHLRSAKKTKTKRWQSHVRNFYDDYPGKIKKYLYGPDNAMTGSDAENIHKNAKIWLCGKWVRNQKLPIDLVGHSRGGFIVLTIAHKLKTEGCCYKGKIIKPVSVRFLGLYDAVDMVAGYGEGESIPDNVKYATHAMGDSDLKSRSYFNTADHGVDDSKKTTYNEQKFWGTHSAIGGAPWMGDHPKGGSKSSDISASILADMFIRKKVKAAGVNIKQLKVSDYGY